MKIEDCIENFILSINEKNSQLFCNLLGLGTLQIKKKLYISRNYISINRYVKERYLEKLSRLVLHSYEKRAISILSNINSPKSVLFYNRI